MTAKEFMIIADVIKTGYPRENMLATEEAMDLWYDLLRDLDYRAAHDGIRKYITSNKFPPTIADIRECALSLTEPEELNEMEAWGLVRTALANSAYGANEEFAKLPPLVQKAVGVPDQLRIWGVDENYSESVTCSQFIRCYKTVCEREKNRRKMPEQVRTRIDAVNANSPAGILEQKRRSIRTRSVAGQIEQKYGGLSADMLDALDRLRTRLTEA